jgi:hypothetical protein
MKQNLKPVLESTGVRIWLGDHTKDSPRKRYASGLDYADMTEDKATIIEFVSSKDWDKVEKMKTKYGQNLFEAIWEVQSKAINQVFGEKSRYGKDQYTSVDIEWDRDWDEDNVHDWGLMKNPWHPNNM